MGGALLAIRVALAAVFLVAGVGKLLDMSGSRRALEEFGVPESASGVATPLLPAAELAVATGLIIDATARYAAAASLVLLVAFVAAIARAMSRGQTPQCHCFGQLHSEPAGARAVVRNLFLALLAAIEVVGGPGPRLPGGLGHLTATESAVAIGSACVIAVLLAGATVWVLPLRVRRRLNRPSGFSAPAHLPAGSPAPDFELQPLRGEMTGLRDLLRPGLPAVLVFVGTDCRSCDLLLPELARWQESLAATLTLVAVFSGGHSQAVELSQSHRLGLALVDEAAQTLRRYGLTLTPGAVLVDRDGMIGGGPAEGVPAIEALIRSALQTARSPAVLAG